MIIINIRALHTNKSIKRFSLKKNPLILYCTFFEEPLGNISNTSDSVSSGYPNTEKRVENTTRSGVFLTKFEVFG